MDPPETATIGRKCKVLRLLALREFGHKDLLLFEIYALATQVRGEAFGIDDIEQFDIQPMCSTHLHQVHTIAH